MKRHNIVIPKDDGGIEVYAMKQWLRENPQHLPDGVETTVYTSHQLRGILKKRRWTISEGPTEVSLIPPEGLNKVARIESIIGNDEEELDSEIEANGIQFELEHQLRDFIAGNLSSIDINGKRLKLYIDPSQREGIEFPTDVGPIDILAVDSSGNFFVFELKRAVSPDRAMGQLARYMGWVKHTVGKGRDVSGVIVAKTISEKLRFAASIVPNVHLYEYEVSFELTRANQLRS